MPLIPAGRAVFSALMGILVAGPVLANGHGRHGPGLHQHVAARTLPAEVRYRDPRYVPSRRRSLHFGPPAELIHAYLPRNTEAPIYNEPPSRFPRR